MVQKCQETNAFIILPVPVVKIPDKGGMMRMELNPCVLLGTILFFTSVGLGENKLYFAHLGWGGDDPFLQSDVVLTNPSATSTVTGNMAFFNRGLPMGIILDPETGKLLQSVEFSVPPLGAVTFSSPGKGGSVRSGWGVVTADGQLGGVVRWQVSGIGIAGVAAGQPVSGCILPVRRKSNEIGTGIAVLNPDWGPVSIRMILRDTDGNEVPDGVLYLPLDGRSHESRFVGDYFSHLGIGDFEGTVTIEVGCPEEAIYLGVACEDLPGESVVVLGLEMGIGREGITTLPVAPLLE